MTPAEFDVQFNRLTAHFHLPADASRETLVLDWLKAVEHFHVEALERAVTELIRTEQDRFWPALGKLLALIHSRMGRYDRTHGRCQTCHGATWLEAWPVVWDGRLYEMFARCPDCGVPAPEMKKPHPGARAATKEEYANWRSGEFARDTMPEWAKAKPWKSEAARMEHTAAMRDTFERLRIKLFGSGEDAA
jgi:hypothetical protein